MKKRVSKETWESEMLCRRPSVHGCVFPNFDAMTHVREQVPRTNPPTLSVDFGYANPFVCLWIATADDGRTHVIDEYVQRELTVDEHLKTIAARPWNATKLIACDPAGAGRNEQTAQSSVGVLRECGYAVRHRASRIIDGVEMIRAALRPASGEPMLFIHPRCKRLIKALTSYRFADNSELPLKDGEHDHLIDALRYHYVNRRSNIPPPRRY